MRNRKRLLSLALLLLAAPAFIAACSYRNGDLAYVNQKPYWSKAYFNPNDSWYYKTTVVDAPPSFGLTGIGDGDWLMLERVRWEVTETQLIAWTERANAPGTEYDQYEGASDIYKGQPAAIFAITEHFDLRRNFDTTTGEQGNVLTENYDRPWYQREFMRVDWSKNLVPTYKWHIWLEQIGGSYAVQNDAPGNPKRYRFETEDGSITGKPTRFEVTTRTALEPDVYSVLGYYGSGYAWDMQTAVVDIRHDFLRVPESDYIPQPMPPSVVLVDENGEEVRDDHGFAVRAPINDRFGFFGSLGRNTFDENRGIVSSGQVWNASRFNIWQKSRNPDGTPIPIEQREPKPIVYYTNVEHPKALMNGSRRVEAEWNRVFKDAVFHAQPNRYASIDDVPDMWVLKENDCNIANVQTWLDEKIPDVLKVRVQAAARTQDGRFDGTLADVKARYDHANDPTNTDSFTVRQTEETQALNDLERICAALEYYTHGDITIGLPKGVEGEPFSYQRLGDTRFSMLNLVMQDHQSGWLGLGPPYADPFTGETISATANLAIHLLDGYAAEVARQVGILNGEVEINDLTFGEDIHAYMRKKLAENKILVGRAGKSQELKEEMDRRLAGMLSRPDALREISPARAQTRKEKLRDTSIEQMLVSQDDILMLGGVDPAAAAAGTVQLTDEILDRASPLRGGVSVESAIEKEHRIARMGMRAMDAIEYLDTFALGRALELRDMSYEERFAALREELYVGVQLHEVGHNVGLMHNFAGSSDALNYGKRFWELRKLPEDIDDAIGATDDEEIRAQLEHCASEIDAIRDAAGQPDFVMTTYDCLVQSENMSSSVMDYHGNWNGRSGGLGPYDFQAIKFAYTNLVEVFKEDALAPSFNPASTDLKRWTFLNDWRDIAGDVVKSEDDVNNREYVKFEWSRTSARRFPERTVPYRFCYGYPPDPTCQTRDFGPDTQTNAQFKLNQYFQRYFFTHFARGRLWDWYGANVLVDIGPMLDFTQKMQFYFFYKATDPEFTGSYAEQDFLATTVSGLNFLSTVIGHPGSGRYVTMPKHRVFSLTNLPADERVPAEGLQAPSDILLPWNFLSSCDAANQTVIPPGGQLGSGVFEEPLPGYMPVNIDLGDGRPFFIGLTEDYEEWYLRYIGTYWSKSLAIQLLGYNYAWFPRFDSSNDFRTVDVSWYRLFPNEVSRIFNSLIAEQWMDLGPVVTPEGEFKHRHVIDPETGLAPDYSDHLKVFPSISYNHQYGAMIYANLYMRSSTDDQLDLTKSMKVALAGGDDDMAAFDRAIADAQAQGIDPSEVVAEFTHPVSGLTMRALKAGSHPIAWNMIQRLHAMGERYQRLQGCVEAVEDDDPATLPDDPYCSCIETVNYTDETYVLRCVDTYQAMPGTEICTIYDLKNRRDFAREAMDDMFDYLGDLRFLNRVFEYDF